MAGLGFLTSCSLAGNTESGNEAGKALGSQAMEMCCEEQAPLIVYLVYSILNLA